MTCAFCGTVVERSYINDEHERLSAEKLAKSACKYKTDLQTHKSLESRALSLADEVSSLSQQDTGLPMWVSMILPAFLAGCVILLVLLCVGYQAGSKPMMILTAVLSAALVVGTVSANAKKKKLRRSAEETNLQLKQKLGQLTAARNELEAFDQTFDIDAVPKEYRSDDALDFIIGLFKSGQSSKLGEAFRRYDERRHFNNMEAMQKEQIAIEKKQLEIMDQLADYDFDDTYDDDDFTLHETLKAFRDNR